MRLLIFYHSTIPQLDNFYFGSNLGIIFIIPKSSVVNINISEKNIYLILDNTSMKRYTSIVQEVDMKKDEVIAKFMKSVTAYNRAIDETAKIKVSHNEAEFVLADKVASI